MKKFLINITLFLLPVVIFLTTVEFLLRKIPNDYSYKYNYLLKKASAIEVLALGSSHSFYGINPLYFNKISYNAAYVSQDLKYDYCIFNLFSKNFKNLKTLVINISYSSLVTTLETSDEDWRIINYKKYNCDLPNKLKYRLFILNFRSDLILKKITLYLNSYFNKKSLNITSSELGFGTSFSNVEQMDLNATGEVSAQRHTKNLGSP